MVEDAINSLECPHHPDATVEKEIRLPDPFYEVARFYKDHDNGDEPVVYKQPSQAQSQRHGTGSAQRVTDCRT